MKNSTKAEFPSSQDADTIDLESGDDVFMYDGREYRKLITTEKIGAFPERVKQTHRAMLCCSIAGECDDLAELVKPDTGQVFIGLVGDFEAVVYNDDGTVKGHAKAPMCFLPGGAHDAAVNTVKRWLDAKANSALPNELPHPAFFLDLYAEESGNPRGYSWMWRNRLRYNPENDRLTNLRKQRDLSIAAEAAARGQPLIAR